MSLKQIFCLKHFNKIIFLFCKKKTKQKNEYPKTIQEKLYFV